MDVSAVGAGVDRRRRRGYKKDGHYFPNRGHLNVKVGQSTKRRIVDEIYFAEKLLHGASLFLCARSVSEIL